MTLTVSREEDDQRQLKLTVEVSEDRVEEAMRRHARRLAGEVRIPGFRPGKVPYHVIVQRYGRDTLRAEAVEEMLQSVYEEAATEADVVAYGRPVLLDMEIEPLVLTFKVPLEPVVKLGDYRSLRKTLSEIEISDDAVDEALERVRIKHQEIETVDRPAELGDLITVSGYGSLEPQAEVEKADEREGETGGEGDSLAEQQPLKTDRRVLFDEESLELLLDSDKVFPGTTFVESLVGSSAGDQVSFSTTFPDGYEDEDLAGKTATFELSILDVKRRELPLVDGDLAKLEGAFETVEELRDNLREQLEDNAKTQLRDATIDGMVDSLLEDAELSYPLAAIESEIDDRVDTFQRQVERSGWDFADYLKLRDHSEEDLREDFRNSSEEALRRQLVLRQFVLDEKLRIEPEDIDALIDQRISRYDNEELRDGLRKFYTRGTGFEMISSEVLSNKVYERIATIYAGTAPDLEDLERAAELRVEEEE